MAIPKGVCVLALKTVAEEYLDPAEIDNFLLEHDARVKELMAQETLLQQAEAETQVAKEMADELKAEAILAKRNAAQQTLKTLKRLNWIKENYKPSEYNDALKHMLGGTVGEYKPGASNSVAKRMDAMAQKAHASFLTELQKNDYDKFFADPKNHKAIMIELHELAPGGKPGRSGSETAKEIAAIMERHQDFWRQEANKAGAFIEKLPGYSIAQTHDVAKLHPRKGESVDDAFKRWADDIKPLLNWGRTFRGQKADKVLREMWDGLSTGVHLDYTNGIGIATGGNRAQRLSNSRKIHFKDGESFYIYNEKYGMGGLAWGYTKGLERLSRNAALMGEMGVNPQKMVDDLYSALKITTSRSKEAGARTSMSLGEMDTHWDPTVRNYFLEVTGKNKIPGSQTFAQVMQQVRGYNSLCRLGMATISSFSDIATQLSHATFMGISRNEALVNMVRTLTDVTKKGLTPAEKQMLSSFGLLAENLTANLHDAINAGNIGNGWLAKAQNRYFRMIGLDWWTTSLKKAMALSVNHDLGEFLAKGKDFGDFKHTMQKMLASYNLGEKEMALLKKMPLIEEGKRFYIDTANVHQIPDEDIAKYLGITPADPAYETRIKNMKSELETRLRTFVYDRVTAGVIEPDVVTHAWLNQGTQAGTIPGEAFRSFGQFKSFAVSIITRIVNPWLFNTTGAERIMGLSELFLTTTALGYLAMSCKDAVRGKEPMELSPQSLLRAMLQGGALGLFGDILFGDANKSSITASFLGPVANMTDDLYQIYAHARELDEDTGAEAIKRLRNYIPGQNIFWVKTPLDYFLMYRIQEAANPGYLERLERNLYNKTGQEYWLSPGTFVN